MSFLIAILFPFSFWGSGTSCADPIMGPNPGVYSHHPSSLLVNFSTITTTANLRYTTNGVDPTTVSGTLVSTYFGSITVPRNATRDLRVIAFVPSGPVSNVVRGFYENYDGDPP